MPVGLGWGTQKPWEGVPLDQGHPLNPYLRFSFLANRSLREDRFNRAATTSGLPVWINTERGPAIRFDGGSFLTWADTPQLRFGSGPFTIELCLRYTVLQSAFPFVKRVGSGNFEQYALQVAGSIPSSPGTVGGRIQSLALTVSGGSNWAGRYTNANFNDGLWHHVIATFDGTTTSATAIWVDGVQPATSTDVIGNYPNTDGAVALALGAGSSGTAFFTGDVLFARLWRKSLSPAEAYSLFVDPYQIYRSRWRYWSMFPAAGGGAFTRTVAGDQPAATATLARILQALRTMVGSQPAASATLTRILQALRTVSGTQPYGTGTVTRIYQAARSLVGSQPSASATLTRILQALRTLLGAQPNATGTLTRVLQALRTLTGSQPNATGILARSFGTLRSVVGSQPAASGTLSSLRITARTLLGSQPNASATLTRVLNALRGLLGNQPTATGTLTRQVQSGRVLTGAQPAASATLTRQLQTARVLVGAQPAASGTLSAVAGSSLAIHVTRTLGTGRSTSLILRSGRSRAFILPPKGNR